MLEMIKIVISVVSSALITAVFFLIGLKKARILVCLEKSFEIDLDARGITQNSKIIVNNKDTRNLVGYTLSFYLKSFKDFEHIENYDRSPSLIFENFELLSITSGNESNKAEVALPRRKNNTGIGLCIRKMRGHYLATYTIIGHKFDDRKPVSVIYEDEFIKDYVIRFVNRI